MAVSYSQAARRHFDDCEILIAEGRAGNASHLAGMAAECALKAVLAGVGVLVLNSGGMPSNKDHHCHIDKFWNEFQSSMTGPRARAYVLAGTNPFAAWSVHHRYEEDRTVDLPTAEGHCLSARKAMMVLERA